MAKIPQNPMGAGRHGSLHPRQSLPAPRPGGAVSQALGKDSSAVRQKWGVNKMTIVWIMVCFNMLYMYICIYLHIHMYIYI